jgi:NADPH2:quinone reductase
MKAIALTQTLPLDDPKCFAELDLPTPTPGPRDLLVRVRAVALNPIDTKVRKRRAPDATKPTILGWDAAGVVEAVGDEVTRFKAGDEVWYAGDVTRDGCNAQYQCVDERIVAAKPKHLDFAQAAAMPLTTITAWEGLFDRMGFSAEHPKLNEGKTLLVIGGAGGVGSICIQIAARLAGLTVVATASRENSAAWCREMGAQHVINHQKPLLAQLKEIGVGEVDGIYNCADVDTYWVGMAEAIRPQGKICAIVDNREPLNLALLKPKCASFHWEFMFARSMYRTPDMEEQHRLLTRVAVLMDQNILTTTHRETLGPLTVENLRKAHQQQESGAMIGKMALVVE